MILGSQMLLEQAEYREGDGAAFEKRVDVWKSTDEPSRIDSATRLVLAEPEARHAIAEEGRKALAHVKAASVHFAQVSDEIRRYTPMRTDQNLEPFQQYIIRNRGESLHDIYGITLISHLSIDSLRDDRARNRGASHFLSTSASRSIPERSTYVLSDIDGLVARAFENHV
jgi:hypothetical protein